MYSGQTTTIPEPRPSYPRAKQIITYLSTLPNSKTIKIIGKLSSGQVFESGTFEMTGSVASRDLSRYLPYIERCIAKDGILKICVSEYAKDSVDSLPWKRIYGFMTVDAGPICRLSATQSRMLHEALMESDGDRTFITYG